MAYKVPNPIYTNSGPFTPTGNTPSVATSFGFPLNGPAVFNPVYSSVDAVKASIENWFMTNIGERPLNINFGANLRAFIFEAISTNTFEILEQKIKDDLKKYFPMVNLKDLSILGNPDTNQVKISITYNILDYDLTNTIDLIY